MFILPHDVDGAGGGDGGAHTPVPVGVGFNIYNKYFFSTAVVCALNDKLFVRNCGE